MKKKYNPSLLAEELKRFKLLLEYDFYQEKKEMPEYKDLLLGDKDISEVDGEEPPTDLKPDDEVGQAADNVASDLGVDGDTGTDTGTDGGETADDTAEMPEMPDAGSEPDAAPAPEPASDDVEVDVTALVKGSEEAKKAADASAQISQQLLQKLTSLEARVANMTAITNKIDSLEKEIIKRNPTPVEKLEMRSLSSYPYSQKLTDYWADKEGAYDVMGKEKEEPKEYVLTKDDVDSDYSEASLKKSFGVKDKENLYEEENIKDFDEEDI